MSRSKRVILVNGITFSRVPLIFLFLACAVVAHGFDSALWALGACIAMFLAGISDLFDGYLARKWQVVSAFGKMADPLMDKVFFTVSFPTLVWLAAVQGTSRAHALALLLFTVLWILRDLWVTFLRSVASRYGADVAAMWLGKVRTAVSFPAAGAIYVYLGFRSLLPEAAQCAGLTACLLLETALMALNVWSFVTYTRAYRPYLQRALGKDAV